MKNLKARVSVLEDNGLSIIDSDLGREIPSNYADDPYICPFGLDGVCEGMKDPEYNTRCSGSDFPYSRCEIYHSIANSSR